MNICGPTFFYYSFRNFNKIVLQEKDYIFNISLVICIYVCARACSISSSLCHTAQLYSSNKNVIIRYNRNNHEIPVDSVNYPTDIKVMYKYLHV